MHADATPQPTPLHEHLRNHARRTPDKPAYLWYGAPLTYAELDRMSDAFAASLSALGVAKGEPVALFLGNCPQYAIAHFGIQKLGAIVCPCSPLFKSHELQYQLEDLGARVIVAAAPLLPIVSQVRGQTAIQHVFAVHYADLLPDVPSIDVPIELAQMRAAGRAVLAGAEDFLASVRSPSACPAVTVDMDDVALMTYTSGTTGLPKGAMLTYDNALSKTAAAVECMGGTADDVLLAVAPMYHIAGMIMGINFGILSGATTVLLYRFDPRAALQAIERHRVSWWYSIAPMNVAAMQLPDVGHFDLGSLRTNPVTSFGITMPESLARHWQSMARNCGSFEAAYGCRRRTRWTPTCRPTPSAGAPTASRCLATRSASSTRTAGRTVPPEPLERSSSRAVASSKGIGASPRQRPRRCATAGFTRATWDGSTMTVTSPFSDASRK